MHTCVMTHLMKKPDELISEFNKFSKSLSIQYEPLSKCSVESSHSFFLSKKSAALEADAAFYKYSTRRWRVKASMYCPLEYYLEAFKIHQHKIETRI